MLHSKGLYQRMVTNNKYVNKLISTGNITFTTENGGMKSWQRADTQKVGEERRRRRPSAGWENCVKEG